MLPPARGTIARVGVRLGAGLPEYVDISQPHNLMAAALVLNRRIMRDTVILCLVAIGVFTGNPLPAKATWAVAPLAVSAAKHGTHIPILRAPAIRYVGIPRCRVSGETYRPGYCVDPPNVLSVGPLPGNAGNLVGLPAQHRTYGSIIVKAAVANPLINDQRRQIVYGQLLVRHKPVPRLRMTATWHYRNGNKVCRPVSGVRGVASCSEPALALGTKDLEPVAIGVAFSYRGRSFTVQTSYRAASN